MRDPLKIIALQVSIYSPNLLLMTSDTLWDGEVLSVRDRCPLVVPIGSEYLRNDRPMYPSLNLVIKKWLLENS